MLDTSHEIGERLQDLGITPRGARLRDHNQIPAGGQSGMLAKHFADATLPPVADVRWSHATRHRKSKPGSVEVITTRQDCQNRVGDSIPSAMNGSKFARAAQPLIAAQAGAPFGWGIAIQPQSILPHFSFSRCETRNFRLPPHLMADRDGNCDLPCRMYHRAMRAVARMKSTNKPAATIIKDSAATTLSRWKGSNCRISGIAAGTIGGAPRTSAEVANKTPVAVTQQRQFSDVDCTFVLPDQLSAWIGWNRKIQRS
jgi:hypothetical protein